MKIGTVVEGPTDRLLLKAIIDELYPGEHDYKDLQPIGNGASFGPTGTGWKGVRRFCFDLWQFLNTDIIAFIIQHQFDLLIIQVDADIALESDLQEGVPNLVKDMIKPCPPMAPTITKLQEVISRWLNLDGPQHFPAQLILAIPAQNSENWVFAGLFPNHERCQQPDYECIHPQNSHKHPAYLLTVKKQYGKILRRKDGKIKKSKSRYRHILPDVVNNRGRVCEICSQARAFDEELRTNVESLDK